MTFRTYALAVPEPAIRTIEEAQVWCHLLYGTLLDLAKRYNALLAEARKSQASAITSVSAVTLTDPTEIGAVTDPADTPASADALRDDLVTNTIPSIESKMNILRTEIVSFLNEIEAGFAAHRTAVNSQLAALRTNKIVAT